MSEFEPELIKELAEIGRQAGWRRYAEGVPHSFFNYAVGSEVEIELVGESISGIMVGDDQIIAGTLLDPKKAEIQVEDATHQSELIGKNIFVGTFFTAFPTPAGCVPLSVRSWIQPLYTMAYYFSEGTTTDFIQIPARYGRITVGGEVMFDCIL